MRTQQVNAALWILLSALPSAGCVPEATAVNERASESPVTAAPRRAAYVFPDEPVDLGVLPGGEQSIAFAINNNGTIVGYSADAKQASHLVRWSRGMPIEDLGQFNGQPTYGLGIDDAQEIVGNYGALRLSERSLYSSSFGRAGERAFYWSLSTGFLALPGQGPSQAQGVQRINGGTSVMVVGCDAGRLAVWTNAGTGFVLHKPALPWIADSSCGYAINRRGEYIGLARGGPVSAFLYRPRLGIGFTSLAPTYSYHEAWALSETPLRVVGSRIGYEAILYPTADASPLTVVHGDFFVNDQALGVNNQTEVVGASDDGAFYWNSESGAVGLPTIDPDPIHFSLSSKAYAINDSSEAVGWSFVSGETRRATLWRRSTAPTVVTVVQLPFDTATHLPPIVSYLPKQFINDGILSRPGFDATRIDPRQITLGDGAGRVSRIALTASGAPMATIADVDGDGDLDLSVSFSKAQLIADGVLTPRSYQFELAFVDVTGLPIKAHYPIWVR